METMVSSSNNTQKEISVWEVLVWSNQPGALHTTVLFIEISIAVFFIMTWLKKEEKEKEEKHYYNNLSNSCLTILLTIIFGKGLEILFRTLHIIFSGAYGNVGFSLDDIVLILFRGWIFVSFGSLLLFNKKLRELLRLFVDAKVAARIAQLQKRLDELRKSNKAQHQKKLGELKATMADTRLQIRPRFEATRDYVEIKMVDSLEVNVPKLEKIWLKFDKIVSKIQEIEAEKEPILFSTQMKSVKDQIFNLNKRQFISELNVAGLQKIMGDINQIVVDTNKTEELANKLDYICNYPRVTVECKPF
ncbi:hypothetical protein GINT2_001095 [Glugoides intestinalis]